MKLPFLKKSSNYNEGIMKMITNPFESFFKSEARSGVLLIICTVLALIFANTSVAGEYYGLLSKYISFEFESIVLHKTMLHWINDGLMGIFFFVVGLEIKREIMVGELSEVKKAMFPVFAAIGGMLIPALVFFFFNHGFDTLRGWGIPMATDIAFALGVLSLQGKNASLPLKIFLVALAIIDDLGAVMVIAVFYTADIHMSYLILAGVVFFILILLNVTGFRYPLIYFAFGGLLWYAFLKSGVHATLAGVLLAFTIPSKTRINKKEFIDRCNYYLSKFKYTNQPGKSILENQEQREAVQSIEISCHRVESPLQRLEHILNPYVVFLIMPLFALANAGVTIKPEVLNGLGSSIALGIIFGLFLGKPIGIAFFAWIAVKLKIADIPKEINFGQIIGVGFLGGIGFTMSIFIGNLAFENSLYLDIVKVSILAGSFLAAITAMLILKNCSYKC